MPRAADSRPSCGRQVVRRRHKLFMTRSRRDNSEKERTALETATSARRQDKTRLIPYEYTGLIPRHPRGPRKSGRARRRSLASRTRTRTMNAPILSSLKINLPTDAGKLETFMLSEPRAYPDKAKGAFNRVAFSAAHVVADARAANDPWLDCAVDWDATLRYRDYLWDLGLGVAEAMDTAQRGMGLDWPTSLELITARRSRPARPGRRGTAARPDLLGLRHRSSRSRQRALHRRGDPRLRGADGGNREGRRPPDRHGEPGAGPRRQVAGRLRARL